MRDLGPNKTASSIMRVAKTLGTIDPVISQFDVVNGIKRRREKHTKLKIRKLSQESM